MSSLGRAFLRLALTAVCIAHGALKLFGLWGGPGAGPGGPHATAAYFAAIDLQPAQVLAVLAGLAQIVGGVLLALGWLTRYVAAAGLVYLGLGIWKAHWKWGFFLNWNLTPGYGHGYEYSLVLGGALLCLLLTGPGKLSIDARAVSRARQQTAQKSG